MSAYIVEDKTISRIVNRLVFEIRNHTFAGDLADKLSDLGYKPVVHPLNGTQGKNKINCVQEGVQDGKDKKEL